jgi:hypothetical protein
MIKPYYKHKHNATVVEVEDFGIINLEELPIRIRLEEKGRYEIGWAHTYENGMDIYVLSEYGGRSSFDFGGRELGVKREIE